MIVSVVAVDPGPTTGICFLDYHLLTDGTYGPPQATVLQCKGQHATRVLEGILMGLYANPVVTQRFGSVEAFVTGQGAGTRGKPAEVTRQLVMELTEALQLYGYSVKVRRATDVKPWGTDKRLYRAGIAKDPGAGKKGEIHGKLRDGFDAARHALYCATWDAKMKDPLA